jgi:chemotaxis protein methyltransferase CheR
MNEFFYTSVIGGNMITLKDSDFKQLAEYIQKNYGINLSRKKNLIEGRLYNLLVERGFSNFSDYLACVFADSTKTEITNLLNRLTTNHTFFMRENAHFEYFKHKVLPYLRGSVTGNDVRIWSAGCSSGEEPYTLAMIMADYCTNEKMCWDKKILATDISVKVLEMAEKGIYSAEVLEEIPKYWKLNYCKNMGDGNYQIVEPLRQDVIFRIFNLMEEVFPFKKKFQVIFCRNVMIYFDYQTKMRLINKFYDMTEPGGYLFIGHSESVGKDETRYQCIGPAIYRKSK